MSIIPVESNTAESTPADDPLADVYESLGLTSYEGFTRVPAFIRVGTRSFRSVAPTGTRHWEIGRRRRPTPESGRAQGQAIEWYQETLELIVPEAIVRTHGIDIHCFNATMEQLEMLDHTFPLVPPDHLNRVQTEKPEGFYVVDRAGRGASASYMGGVNPVGDYCETSNDETHSILITHGAFWNYRDRGFCPTVLHEIGHVMTHRPNGLSYGTFSDERRSQLS